jgi:hypothetical protein
MEKKQANTDRKIWLATGAAASLFAIVKLIFK